MRKVWLFALLVAGLYAAVAFAAVDREPAIHFALELAPTRVSFPPEYKEKMPAIYEAYKQLSQMPKSEQQLRKTYEARIAKVRSGKGSMYKKNKKMAKLKRELAAKLEKLAQKKAELRNAFLFLAEDYLAENSDPYVLYLSARQFYEIRGEPPIVRNKKKHTKKVKAVKFEDADLANLSAEEKKSKTAKKEEKKPIAQKEYKNNYERIEDYCKQIIESFPDFEALDEVYYLLGVTYQETGKNRKAFDTLDKLTKEFPKSPVFTDAMFRKGEIMFSTPLVFDHFDQAYEIYDSITKREKKGSRWYFRALYKKAWSSFLSMNYNEDAKMLFLQLYQELDKMPEDELDKEQKSMKAEAKHMVIQLNRGKPGTYEFFK